VMIIGMMRMRRAEHLTREGDSETEGKKLKTVDSAGFRSGKFAVRESKRLSKRSSF
jgi:hypothetical protein